MMTMTIEASAKINLTLEVFGVRADGYHELRSVITPISLADTLDIELTEDGSITSDTGYPDDLCVKAARTLRSTLNPQPSILNSQFGARIRVTKRIPVGGGLGGGSADAAAMLRALNDLWHLGKTPEELAEIGAAVGSDVPALVLAQHYCCPVLMEGRGEIVTPLLTLTSDLDLHSSRLVLANPGIAVSTAEVYRRCTPRTQPAVGVVNDLQVPAVAAHPEIARTLEVLKIAGATDVMMSGSGATCFGFAADEANASRIAAALNGNGLHAWVAQFLR